MRWFHKQRDPISERAHLLQNQIGALESQIARLSSELEAQPAAPKTEPAPLAEPETRQNVPASPPPAKTEPPAAPPPEPAAEPAPQPRLRSTARPHGPTVSSRPEGEAAGEQICEPVAGNPFKGGEPERPAPERPELGVRKPGWGALWERLKRQLRGPPASNPRLVSYLAAGSLQGLQPLRYEKRVARNRAIALVLLFALVLWWVIVLFVKL